MKGHLKNNLSTKALLSKWPVSYRALELERPVIVSLLQLSGYHRLCGWWIDCVTLDLSGKVKFWLRAARCQESRGRIQWLDHLHPRQLSTFWLSQLAHHRQRRRQVGWSQKTDKLREAAQSRRKSSDERRRVAGPMPDPKRRVGKLRAKLTFATTRRRLSSWHSA